MLNKRGQVSFGDVVLCLLIGCVVTLFGMNYGQYKKLNSMKEDVDFKTKQISDLIDFREDWKKEKPSLYGTICTGWGNDSDCHPAIVHMTLSDVLDKINALNDRETEQQKQLNLLAKADGFIYQESTKEEKPAEFRKRTKEDDAPASITWGSISGSTITSTNWR